VAARPTATISHLEAFQRPLDRWVTVAFASLRSAPSEAAVAPEVTPKLLLGWLASVLGNRSVMEALTTLQLERLARTCNGAMTHVALWQRDIKEHRDDGGHKDTSVETTLLLAAVLRHAKVAGIKMESPLSTPLDMKPASNMGLMLTSVAGLGFLCLDSHPGRTLPAQSWNAYVLGIETIINNHVLTPLPAGDATMVVSAVTYTSEFMTFCRIRRDVSPAQAITGLEALLRFLATVFTSVEWEVGGTFMLHAQNVMHRWTHQWIAFRENAPVPPGDADFAAAMHLSVTIWKVLLVVMNRGRARSPDVDLVQCAATVRAVYLVMEQVVPWLKPTGDAAARHTPVQKEQ
jgi:hypothetical protein